MIRFTQRRFITFPKERQHKKCATILRALHNNDDQELWDHYNEIQSWMHEPVLSSNDHQTISDRYHQHLNLGKVYLNEHSLLPRIRKGDHESPLAPILPVTIYLDHIRSAHNVGSILRTVEAFNLGSVYFSLDTPFADHPQVDKTSMGCSKLVSCTTCQSLDNLPKPLIALETSPDALPIHDFIFPEECCIAIGNEEYGLSKDVLEKADAMVEIPLTGRKNSLNVANAFAIAAATISNQFRSKDCYAQVNN